MHDLNLILADLPGLGRVRMCECNSVHVSIGPVTLNLDPAAFLQMAALIDSARKQLSQIQKSHREAESAFQMIGPGQDRLTH